MNRKPVFKIEKQKKFSNERDYNDFAIVRVRTTIVKRLGGRKSWVRISSGNKHIYRIILGASFKGLTEKAIEMDYDSQLELGLSSQPKSAADEYGFYPCELKVRKANFFEKIIAHWKHPDIAYRVPMQLSIVGFILGVIGFILGILGYA